MNARLLAVLAVGMIGLGAFGLIGLWVYYSRLARPARRVKRRNSDLIVFHRFKQRKRRTLRTALAASAPAMPAPAVPLFAPDQPADDSRWRRPGGPQQPPAPEPAFFGVGQPRHVRIDNTPRVIIPHMVVGPEPRKPQFSQSTRPSRRTALIKTIRVDESRAV